ncbi:solute carrier family 13 member 5-like [Paramuricea clavata]|uniref:Solute carrier family 13 member 5-like n=1 Tax=Paramuricea clavata TaxID=317549 RepID=A0A6S7I578_PARCT|nr:solute carrier family 13 member 5-like [Paramuricea clavata]
MAVYWITEVCPLAVTSLLPLILFPFLGVVEAKQISPPYFSDTNILFMGGLLVAVAVEYWNLHKRIALFVLLKLGVQPRRLLFGFMSVTAFLSMWLSNTATTAMMFPIAQAVLQELREGTKNVDKNGVVNNGTAFEMDKEANHTKEEASSTEKMDSVDSIEKSDVGIVRIEVNKDEQSDLQHIRLCKGTFLSIAYAANIGGTGTLTGTGPNLILSGQADELYPASGGIGFANWFIYAFPEMLLLLCVAWVWIQWMYLETRLRDLINFIRRRPTKSKNSEAVDKATRVVQQQYDSLGPISFAEIAVLVHFVIMALLWLFRDPKFIKGWSILFTKGYVRDGTVGILVAFSLFNFPSRKPKIFSRIFSKGNEYDIEETGRSDGLSETLLNWPTVSQKFAWNIVFLLGAGFAMAKAAKESGLSLWLGQQLAKLDSVPTFVIVLITAAMLCAFTEVTSNTATATIFLPILGTLASSLRIHPWRLMVPATVACSFAFMLPVATPPNAIVFASGYLKVTDMAKTGLFMNIVSVAVLMLWLYTYGTWYFDLDTFPSWAEIAATNKTVVDCITRNNTM